MVRIGIVLLPQDRWPQARARWTRAEEYGFDHAWTYDHLAWRSLADEPWFATVPLLAAAATATERIRLGTWVASPNFRHPVPFAKEVMGLDDISDGRLQLGLGSGGQGFDATVLGEDLAASARSERFAEFTELLDRLLTAPVTEHAGRFYRARGARMRPGCVQQPRVPFVISANGPRAMRLAVRYGQGWATTGPRVASGPGAQEEWWSGVARLVAGFEAACREAGRDVATVDRYLNLDSAPEYSLRSLGLATEGVRRAVALGFTDVVVHWPRAEGVYAGDEAVLTAFAARLPELREITAAG